MEYLVLLAPFAVLVGIPLIGFLLDCVYTLKDSE